jgi:hypothetical protein
LLAGDFVVKVGVGHVNQLFQDKDF